MPIRRIDSHLYGVLTTLTLIQHVALPPHDQRHQYLRYEGLRYTDADIIPDKGELRDYWIGISSARDFLGTASSSTVITYLILRQCHRLFAYSIAGRSQAPKKEEQGSYLGRTVYSMIAEGHNFGLLTEERLRGLTIIAPELLIIDMAELVRLQICMEINDTWAWVALGPKRQPDTTAGAPEAAEDAPIVDEGDQTDLGKEISTNIDGEFTNPEILNYLEHPIPAAPVPAFAGQQVPPEALAAHTKWVKGQKEIVVLMLMTVEPDLQRNLENLGAYDMLQELKTLFSQQAEQELLQPMREFHACKQEEGQSNYNMQSMWKTVNELHAMLKIHEQTLPKKDALALHAIRVGKIPPPPKKGILLRTQSVTNAVIHAIGSRTVPNIYPSC
ncbi:hypothetical protein Tco_1183945 [Tanacetum coccineum]